MTRYLITGGAGFIGRNLAARLRQNEEACVRVFDTQKGDGSPIFDNGTVEFLVGDILDTEALERALAGVDHIIHLAAFTGVRPSLADPLATININVTGSINVLEAARRGGVSSVVLASTAGAIMGDRPPPITEDMAPAPTSPYGSSKLAMEAYASSYAAAYGLPVTCLRFANVYGPYSGNKGGIVTAAIKAAATDGTLTVYGDGRQTRDFVYVGDVCDAILTACERLAHGQAIQIGSGVGTSVLGLIAAVEEVTGRKVQVTHGPANTGEVRNVWCDVSKAAEILAWHPQTNLHEGLKQTAHWFAENVRSSLG